MKSVWIVGSGGLLGSALAHEFAKSSVDVFQPGRPIAWTDPAAQCETFTAAVQEFSDHLDPASPWEIYWAAGVGRMGSDPGQLSSETTALQALLQEVSRNKRLRETPGSVAFASSAGALYAGSAQDVVSEDSELAPNTPYAYEKLKQEALLRDFCLAHPAHRVLIARITTLFGPRSRGRDSKGLFANLAKSMFSGEPVRIFVPLDTMRDYIYADDAAKAIIGTLRSMTASRPLLVKIVAAQRITTVAEIISLFGKIGHRQPRIITGATALTSKYAPRLLFKSCEGSNTADLYRTSLHVCIFRIMEAERLSFVAPQSWK
jgi:UDP-glucose 4-epimerase